MLKGILNFLICLILIMILIPTVPRVYRRLRKEVATLIHPKANIGIITIDTPITSAQKINHYFNKFFKEPSIKAILINIDTAEGAPGSSYAIYHEIMQLKKEYPKPVAVFIQNNCTSGAYEVASAADYIVATPSALIGSIGYYPESKNPGVNIANSRHNQVIETVATARKLTLNEQAVWTHGELFTGKQAQEAGLVDALGNQTTAINKLKELAHISGKHHLVKTDKKLWIETVFTS